MIMKNGLIHDVSVFELLTNTVINQSFEKNKTYIRQAVH